MKASLPRSLIDRISMLLIPCPWCGERSENEFVCGGEASIVRPADPESVDDGEWTRYLFERANARGRQRERWLHRHGCGRWFVIERDTASHEIGDRRRGRDSG
jgi:sarcosine oxidase subunit delta